MSGVRKPNLCNDWLQAEGLFCEKPEGHAGTHECGDWEWSLADAMPVEGEATEQKRTAAKPKP